MRFRRSAASRLPVTMGSSLMLPLVITSAEKRRLIRGIAEQKIVQRRIRQHDAEGMIAGRKFGRERGIRTARQNHYRATDAFERGARVF